MTWFGGDFTKARLTNGTSGWAGGFVRFPMRDSTAPTKPGAVSVTSNQASGATLSWGAASGQARYEVIRDNRVVATTTATSLTVPAVSEPTRYFVRAVDASGNRSASTGVVILDVPPTPEPPAAPVVTAAATSQGSVALSWPADASVASYRIVRDGTQVGTVTAPATSFTDSGLTPLTQYGYQVFALGSNGLESAAGTATARTPIDLVQYGSTWRWRNDSAPWPADWRERTFDDSAWAQGPAVLGFGSAGVVTNIDVPPPTSNRPISVQFRRTFDVVDPSALSQVRVTVRADDGVVVYLNGQEVGRSNLPAGALTQNTYALSGPRTTAAAAAPVTFTVPASMLVPGTNVVSASTHLGWRSTPDVSFELSMSGS